MYTLVGTRQKKILNGRMAKAAKRINKIVSVELNDSKKLLQDQWSLKLEDDLYGKSHKWIDIR